MFPSQRESYLLECGRKAQVSLSKENNIRTYHFLANRIYSLDTKGFGIVGVSLSEMVRMGTYDLFHNYKRSARIIYE